MGILDFFRRRDRKRGVRGQRVVDRPRDQGTVQIRRPDAPAPSAPQPPASRPPPAATVVTPRVEPVVPQEPPAASPPRPPAGDAGVDASAPTEYVDVRKHVADRIVGVLVAVDGPLEGEVYKLFDGENKLGRSPSCQVELPSAKISREHAKLIHRDGVFAIAPLSDRNPTILNDEPTDGAELGDGDFIKLGRTKFRFRSV